MKSKISLHWDKIARGLGADHIGHVHASGGYFGALQLVAEVQARFRAPAGGGRSTDPAWTQRRLIPLAPATLERLEHLSQILGERGVVVAPLQVAALLLQWAVVAADDAAMVDLARVAAG